MDGICQYAAFKTRDISLMRKPISYLRLKEIFKEDIDLVDDIEYMDFYSTIGYICHKTYKKAEKSFLSLFICLLSLGLHR